MKLTKISNAHKAAVSELTGQGIDPLAFRSDSEILNHCTNSVCLRCSEIVVIMQNVDDPELADEDAGEDEEVADQGIVDDGASLEDEDEQETESDDFSDIDSGNEDDTDLASIAESEISNPVQEKEEKIKDASSISNCK